MTTEKTHEHTPTGHLPKVIYAGRYSGVSAVPEHNHPCLELILVNAGECVIKTAQTQGHGKSGSIFLIPPQVVHHQADCGFVATSFVRFDAPHLRLSRMIQIDIDPSSAPTTWISDICTLYQANEKLIVLNLLLAAVLEGIGSGEVRSTNDGGCHPDLIKAVSYLRANMVDPVTVDGLANHVHLSGSRLSELFRQQYGCGPIAYLHSLRMDRAERLLLDGGQSIAEIAEACGYNDANYFIRMFRSRHGVAPERWRKLARQVTSQNGDVWIRWLSTGATPSR